MTAPADDTTVRHASCSCGQLRVTCTGAPLRLSICHCGACKRRTGSAFGVQARYPADRVQVVGEASEWSRVGESGGRATLRFCPRCGATVYWIAERLAGFVSVAVGAFADPSFPAPTIAVYAELAHPWVTTPGIEVLE